MASNNNNGNSGPYPYYTYRNNAGDDQSNTEVVAILLTVFFVLLLIRLIHFIVNQSNSPATDRVGAGGIAGVRRPESQVAVVSGGVPAGAIPLPRLVNAGAPPPLTAAYRREGWKEATCPVCLSDFADGEVVRLLPECLHYFHAACIDEWLRTRATCPLCRAAGGAVAV
uniref:RING-type domain-containing protein n=1 Tax=Leersia perrieri TaxID=77586 RepID=A0A0D9XVP0_9ORYZ